MVRVLILVILTIIVPVLYGLGVNAQRSISVQFICREVMATNLYRH